MYGVWFRPGRPCHLARSHVFLYFFTLVTGLGRSLNLKLSDTRVYEPQLRARLGNHNTRSRSRSRTLLFIRRSFPLPCWVTASARLVCLTLALV